MPGSVELYHARSVFGFFRPECGAGFLLGYLLNDGIKIRENCNTMMHDVDATVTQTAQPQLYPLIPRPLPLGGHFTDEVSKRETR